MTRLELAGAVQRKPIRVRVPGLIDVLLVRDAAQINWLNALPEVTREIDPEVSWLHRLLHGRLLQDLRFADGSVLPAFLAREDPRREERQKALSEAFESLHGLPGPERDEIAAFVAGSSSPDEIGVKVQHWCGRLFQANYRASAETYAAGKLLAGWPSAPPWKTVLARVTGRLEQAKQRISEAAREDPYCVHATTVGTQHITAAVKNLRRAAQRPDKRKLAPDEILRECLVVPPALLRTCRGVVSAPFLDVPLDAKSVIVFLTAQAFKDTGDDDIAFLADGWSACPAREVVPEMLRAVWHAAHHDETAHNGLLDKIDHLSRIWAARNQS